MKQGYVYIAYKKDRYFKQAVVSAMSLKKVDPDAHVTLFTDLDKKAECFDDYRDLNEPRADQTHDNVFEKKFLNIHRTPYERTFLVDTDTYFLDNCRGLFQLLDHYHFCLTPANAYMPIKGLREPYEPIEGLVPYNSGILLFRGSMEVSSVFQLTYKYFIERRWIHRTKRFDIYFTLALAQSPVKVYSLPNIFNARIGSHIALNGPVKILHAAGQGYVAPEIYEEVGEAINQRITGRYWDPKNWKLINEG